MTGKIKIILFVLLLTMTGVNAQEPDMRSLKLSLPESMSGYSVTVRDGAGNALSETTVDTMGSAEIGYDEAAVEVLVNSEMIPETNAAKIEFSLDQLIVYIAIAVLISAALFYFLGRMRAQHILSQLREFVYEENLD